MKHFKIQRGLPFKRFRFRFGVIPPPEQYLYVDVEYFRELIDIYKNVVCNFEKPIPMEKYYQCLGAIQLLEFLVTCDGLTIPGVRWAFSRHFRMGKQYDVKGNCVGEY